MPPLPPSIPYGMPHRPVTSGLAIASLICAFVPVPLINGIAAIVLSVKAQRQIEKSHGTITGSGLATAGMVCGIIFGLIGGLAILAGIAMPVLLMNMKKGKMLEATSHAREIGCALYSFDQDYGSFPCDATAKEVKENCPDTKIDFGGNTCSNDYMRQLIATHKIDQERPFYVKAPYTKKPDNVMTQGKCLAAGECGFGYIMASRSEALSSANSSGCPILVAPLLDARSDGTFDCDALGGKAVVLRIDQSVMAEPIRRSDKHLLLGGGRTLMESGRDTVWGTDVNPVIKPPVKAAGR